MCQTGTSMQQRIIKQLLINETLHTWWTNIGYHCYFVNALCQKHAKSILDKEG
jgi:hypothetical protein